MSFVKDTTPFRFEVWLVHEGVQWRKGTKGVATYSNHFVPLNLRILWISSTAKAIVLKCESPFQPLHIFEHACFRKESSSRF